MPGGCQKLPGRKPTTGRSSGPIARTWPASTSAASAAPPGRPATTSSPASARSIPAARSRPTCWSLDLLTDLLKFGNNAANDLYTERCKDAGQKIHPARFPAALPEFFIKLLTDEGDIVLDPFAGSNTTGAVAERLERRWVAVERVEEYLRGSRFRF